MHLKMNNIDSLSNKADVLIDSVTNRVWRYQCSLRRRSDALRFSIGCLVVCASIYTGLYRFSYTVLLSTYPTTYYVVWLCLFLSVFGCVVGCLVYIYYLYWGTVLIITQREKVLFNVQDGIGVYVVTEQELARLQLEQHQQLYKDSPSRQQQQLNSSCFYGLPHQQQQYSYSPTQQQHSSYSPPHDSYVYPPSYQSLPYSPTDSPYSMRSGGWLNMSSTGGQLSPAYNSAQSLSLSSGSEMLGGSLNLSLGGLRTDMIQSHSISSSTPTGPAAAGAGRRRTPQKSPKRGESLVTSQQELTDYLIRERSQRENNERFYTALDSIRLNSSPMFGGPVGSSIDVGPHTSSSRWSIGLGLIRDWFGPSLSRFRYQPAPLTTTYNKPGSSSSDSCGNTGSSSAANMSSCTGSAADATRADSINTSVSGSSDVWTDLGVTQAMVDRWRQNLRKWISETVLCRVVSEIESVNRTLANIGSDDVQCGKVSIATLKTISASKSQLLPTLDQLILFLDMTSHQQYLVQRLIELSSTGCMSSFRWNSGGDFKGKPWEENLPNDSEIVVHMLCTYLDSRLPVHPRSIDGRTFTSQHFLRVPDKPSDTREGKLYIYQVRIHPPHYKVVIGENIYNLLPGRHNMFDAILLFFFHIKTKEKGVFRRVNLGMSGINLLWIFDC